MSDGMLRCHRIRALTVNRNSNAEPSQHPREQSHVTPTANINIATNAANNTKSVTHGVGPRRAQHPEGGDGPPPRLDTSLLGSFQLGQLLAVNFLLMCMQPVAIDPFTACCSSIEGKHRGAARTMARARST